MEKFIKKNTQLRNIILLLIIWFVLFFPLFGKRFIPTHDGEYHLIRIHEFSTMLKEGNLFPRWAPGLNSGYGFPLFIFHYPFPNYIGSLIHVLGFSLVESFQMSLGIGVLIGLLGCYTFLKHEYKTNLPAMFGSLLFLAIPYLFVDTYIRGSIGEVWAIAWTFVSLSALVWKRNTLLGISVGALVISHNIIAMVMLPVLISYSFLYYRSQLIYVLTGISLGSYFWLPAIVERKYVIGLNSVTYSDHFPELVQLLIPSWGSNFSQPGMPQGEMSQQIGLAPLLIIIVSITKIIKDIQNSSRQLFFLLVTFLGLFLILPVSNVFWQMVPFLQYIQYPWRLLSILLISIPFLGGMIADRTNKYLVLSVLTVTFLSIFSYMKPVTYEPRSDNYYLSKQEFTDGTSSLGNSFSTLWTYWIKERSEHVVTGEGLIHNLQKTSTSISFTVSSLSSGIFRIHRTYYPGWVVTINGEPTSIDYSEGVLDITVPSGEHQIHAVFNETILRRIANGISVITLSSLVLFSILNRKYARSN